MYISSVIPCRKLPLRSPGSPLASSAALRRALLPPAGRASALVSPFGGVESSLKITRTGERDEFERLSWEGREGEDEAR